MIENLIIYRYNMLTLARRLGLTSSRLELVQSFILQEKCTVPLQLYMVPEQRRGMARGRNYYIKGASQKQDISEEARELLRNRRCVYLTTYSSVTLRIAFNEFMDALFL